MKLNSKFLISEFSSKFNYVKKIPILDRSYDLTYDFSPSISTHISYLPSYTDSLHSSL
jgi:hypothetical protein